MTIPRWCKNEEIEFLQGSLNAALRHRYLREEKGTHLVERCCLPSLPTVRAVVAAPHRKQCFEVWYSDTQRMCTSRASQPPAPARALVQGEQQQSVASYVQELVHTHAHSAFLVLAVSLFPFFLISFSLRSITSIATSAYPHLHVHPG